MKNFARIVNLGDAECCVHRRECHELVFNFWLRGGGQVVSPTANKVYPVGGLLDVLFDGMHEDQIEAECHKVFAFVMHQMALHDEQLKDNVPLVLDGATLDKLYRPDAD
jgi:hypothetical protein